MYTIEFTDEAEADLKWFNRREQNIVLDGIKSNLRYEPTVITINRHPCRDDDTKLADWELRIGIYRVYYNVEEIVRVVFIERIGDKPNNTVFLRGRRQGNR
jgi:mRNA-degrading endonuclease RelE of RelBE toxin-antitoxin system